MFKKLPKNLTFEHIAGKTGTILIFLTQSDQVKFLPFLLAFFAHFYAQNCDKIIMTVQKNSLLEGLVSVSRMQDL